MQAVILAAGRGKRLNPISTNRTKAMAPIIGKPIVERVMELLVVNGIRSIIIVISPDDHEIVEYFNHTSTINAEITLVPQLEPLGMSHALQQASPLIKDDFVLSACDNLVEAEEIGLLLKIWGEKRPDALLTTIRVESKDIPRMGILEIKKGRVLQIVEKPAIEDAPSNFGSLPLYVFSTNILDNLDKIPLSPRGEYELQNAIQLIINQGADVRAVQLKGRNDLTNPEDLLKINQQFLIKNYHQKKLNLENVERSNIFIPPFFIEDSVVIGDHCQIGPNVYIEHGSNIGDKVHLRDVVVLRNRKIPGNTTIENQLVW